MIMKWTGYFILMIICCFSISWERSYEPLTTIIDGKDDQITSLEARQNAVDGIKMYLQRRNVLTPSDEFRALTVEEMRMKLGKIFEKETGVSISSENLIRQLLNIHIQENSADVIAHFPVLAETTDIDDPRRIQAIDDPRMIDIVEEWVYLSLLHPNATEQALLPLFRESAKNGETTLSLEIIKATYPELISREGIGGDEQQIIDEPLEQDSEPANN